MYHSIPFKFLVILQSFLVSFSNANVLGVDLCNLSGVVINSTVFDCFKKEQNRDLVVTFGEASPTTCTNLNNAKKSGFHYGEVVYIPYPTATTGSSSVKSITDYLNTNCKDAWDGKIWVDVFYTQGWPVPWTAKGYQENKDWLTETVNYCVSSKTKCGIRATPSTYITVFNDAGFNVAAKAGLPLWSYGDVSKPTSAGFGGWTVPAELIIGDVKVSVGTYDSCHMPNSFYTNTEINL